MRAAGTVAVAFAVVVFAIALWRVYVDRRRQLDDPLVILRRRLAAGEITEEEFLERESALRMTEKRRR